MQPPSPNPQGPPAAAPPREPQVGEAVGPYPILGELGRGGMAVVYRSKDPVLPREIALKIMLPKVLGTDPHAVERFLREAGAQARVEHPHVVPIYQAGEWHGVPFIAMPRLKGRTLAAQLKEHRETGRRFAAAELVRIGRQVAEGLEAAHAAGLVHRDIKPGNIWLEEPKQWVKLLDFGLAREEAVTAAGAAAGDPKRRAIVGTPSYMSPEQATGAAVDARTDLWSLGVVLYQMAAGEKPFAGATRYELIQSVLEDEPLPLSAPGLPPGLIDLVTKLLSKDPGERPRSAGEVVAALTALEHALRLPTAVELPAPAVVAAPELWGALDDLPKEAGPARTRRGRDAGEDDAEPRPKRAARAEPAKGPPWALIGGGAAVGLLLVGLVVWLASGAGKSKPPAKDETAAKVTGPKDEPKRPEPRKGDARKADAEKKEPDKKVEPPPAPAPTDDRKAAEVLGPRAALRVRMDGAPANVLVAVPPGQPLPAGRFELVEISLQGGVPPPDFLTATLLPSVRNLRSLVSLQAQQVAFRPEHIEALAGAPFGPRLAMLLTATELTPATVDALAKLPALGTLGCRIPGPTDALFAKLGALKLRALIVTEFGPGAGLTGAGWESFGRLPLVTVCLLNAHLDRAAVAGLAEKGRQRNLILAFGTTDDDALAGLGEGAKGLREVTLWELPGVTDKGLRHLANAPALTRVAVCGGGVTAEGIKALKKAHPRVAVDALPAGSPFQLQLELPIG